MRPQDCRTRIPGDNRPPPKTTKPLRFSASGDDLARLDGTRERATVADEVMKSGETAGQGNGRLLVRGARQAKRAGPDLEAGPETWVTTCQPPTPRNLSPAAQRKGAEAPFPHGRSCSAKAIARSPAATMRSSVRISIGAKVCPSRWATAFLASLGFPRVRGQRDAGRPATADGQRLAPDLTPTRSSPAACRRCRRPPARRRAAR